MRELFYKAQSRKATEMAKARRLVKLLAAVGLTFALASSVWAMPTKRQLMEASRLVQELTADDLRDLKAKKKTAGDVAAVHLALADKAETEAGKYLLLQGAFRLYARSGDYDSAAATLLRMRGEIADLPPEVIIEIVNSEMRRVAGSKAPKVLAIFRDAQRRVKYRKRLAAADLDATAHPENPVFARRLAECHVGLGDWPKALPIFAKLGDIAAKYELDPASAKDCNALKAADFWWNYESTDSELYKAHAAALYRTAIDTGIAKGLRREMAVMRLAEIEESGLCGLNAATTAVAERGASAPTSAAKAPATTTGPWAIPANFKAPLVRTLKLADGVDMDFCAVPAGTFKMSNVNGKGTHKVTITRPFWIGKWFLSAADITGDERDAKAKSEIMKVLPNMEVIKVPIARAVPEICKSLNDKYRNQLPAGYVFRLPTEAELEYALTDGKGLGETKCQSCSLHNTTKDAFAGKAVQWCYDLRFRVLPRKQVCKWGLSGISWTTCAQLVLDTVDTNDIAYEANETDPVRIGQNMLGRDFGIRRHVKQSFWAGISRLVIGPDLVAEKQAGKK